VATLIDAGTNLHHVTSEGWAALMYASDRGHIDVVKALLDAGALPNYINNDDVTTFARVGRVN
jgi:ankyrin repeat protein